MPFALILIGIFVVCFLLGSIPWGVVISRLFFSTDVRQHGSGNIGTTNSFRALGKVGGTAVFLLDFGKGLLAGFIALAVCGALDKEGVLNGGAGQVIQALAFLSCVLGHVFSPWLGFKGGKGIAVAIGCLFPVFGPIPAVIELLIFACNTLVTRKVSVGSLAAAIACPIVALYVFWGNWLAWILVLITAGVVIWAHRGNIERLRDGTESTIGKSKDTASS